MAHFYDGSKYCSCFGLGQSVPMSRAKSDKAYKRLARTTGQGSCPCRFGDEERPFDSRQGLVPGFSTLVFRQTKETLAQSLREANLRKAKK